MAIVIATKLFGGVRPDFGAFAGYSWTGRVTSIAGSWRVPAIASPSRAGNAATWIGAQQGSEAVGPFIQIGTDELRDRAHGNNDFAFWSDTKKHFHPVPIGSVAPGDLITASLRLEPRRWVLAISDVTAGQHIVFSTTDETPGTFDTAEWLQEDPTLAKTNRLGPYPRVSPVTFTNLMANGRPPQSSDLIAAFMSPRGASGQDAPTVPSNDSFTVRLLPLAEADITCPQPGVAAATCL